MGWICSTQPGLPLPNKHGPVNRMWTWFQRKAVGTPSTSAIVQNVPEFVFRVKASVLTDTGMREANEDAVCVQTHPDPRLRTVRMVGLADGMGGHSAGEVASRLCLDACCEILRKGSARHLELTLLEALHGSNQAVWQAAKADASLNGMGTTLCLLAFQDDRCWFAWVGDSRVYRLRDGVLQQLTHDDTVVNALVAQGVLNPDEAECHPESHVLSQALGTSPELARPHVGGPETLQHDDLFLLTSDGVHDVLKTEQIADLLGPDIHASGQRLISQAKLAGSQDNLSAVVVHVQRQLSEPLNNHDPSKKVTTVEAEPCE
jgi:PPM family protein phosphatase